MSLADDWGSSGRHRQLSRPRWFQTQQNKVLYENAAWVEYLSDRIPSSVRPARDLDGAVVFLASESSRYITGRHFLSTAHLYGATKATV